MHKIVNGIKIEFSAEEEKIMIEGWKSNEIKDEQRKLKLQRKIQVKENARNKLFGLLNLSQEEKELLF